MSPKNVNDVQLSTSIDITTPWLAPVAAATAEDFNAAVNYQESSHLIKEPKVIDILVNDQQRHRRKKNNG